MLDYISTLMFDYMICTVLCFLYLSCLNHQVMQREILKILQTFNLNRSPEEILYFHLFYCIDEYSSIKYAHTVVINLSLTLNIML